MKTQYMVLVTTLACLGTGCSASDDTMIVVSVDAPNSVAAAYYLRVTTNNNGDPDYKQFPTNVASSPLTFPTSFGLHLPRDRKGTITFNIDALDESTMSTVATGKGSLEIKVGERMDLCVGLTPKCGNASTGPSTSPGDGGVSNPATNPDGRVASSRGGLTPGLRFASVAAGSDHSCAVATDGSLWCWGANALGQLGVNDTLDNLLPLRVAGNSWTNVAAGSAATCALQSTGALACWGNNGSGQVGNAMKKAGGFVAIPFPLEGTWSKVSVGWYHALALQPDGTLLSWGDNSSDQLGDSTAPSEGRAAPAPVNNSQWLVAEGATVAAGNLHSCAIGSDHSLSCWGNNATGQLGDGTTHMRLSPTALPGNDWAQVSAGFYHTCAIKTDASLWCWGDNSKGQLGSGSTSASRTPARVSASDARWTAVSTGHTHTCGLQSDDSLWCWGDNGDGQIGTGQATTTPTLVKATTASWKVVSAGDGHTCAVASDATLWCWGRNKSGQVGNGTTSNQSTPLALGS